MFEINELDSQVMYIFIYTHYLARLPISSIKYEINRYLTNLLISSFCFYIGPLWQKSQFTFSTLFFLSTVYRRLSSIVEA